MTRPTRGHGLFYTRDSGGKHEMTPAQYLSWANRRAVEIGVEFKVGDDAIQQMIEKRQSVYGNIYLDYDVCGNLLSRPALDALKARIDADQSVSHLFIPRRDRLARPNEPTDGLVIENALRRSGITLVFRDKVLGPIARGERIDIGEMITGVVDYDKAGKERRDLAQKILDAHLSLNRAGFSTGGRPCYGFRRWLVRIDGARVRELVDGERVRMAGHHVVWLPVPDDHSEMTNIRRIRAILMTMPASHVARTLNSEGIPGPDSGRRRRDLGVEHPVSGVWHQTTIINIGRKALFAAVCSYGRRSMGDQLRFSPGGPRMLIDDDFRPDHKPKVIRNAPEMVQRAPALFEPVVPLVDHDALQSILDGRATSQRGKPRSRDPNNNPLGGRVFDLSCGWPLYRAPYNGSYRYTCGLYTQSRATQCGHHHIDGPQATRLIVNSLIQRLLTPTGAMKLHQRLAELAAAELVAPVSDSAVAIRAELVHLQSEQEKIGRNMALSETPEQRSAVAAVFNCNCERIAGLQQQLNALQAKAQPVDAQSEVKSAIAVLGRLANLLTQTDNTSAASAAIKLVNARLFLGFTTKQLKKRTVNTVSRGLITFGTTPAPIQLYAGPTGRRAIESNLAALSTASPGGNVTHPDQLVSGREGNSLGNVSRGDRI